MITNSTPLSQRNVLLVEDCHEMTALLSDFFLMHDAQPILARTASQALYSLQQDTFDLLILDLDISSIDSLMILQFLNGRQCRGLSRLTIVLSSCPANNELIPKVRSLHMPVLIKPFDLQDLYDLCARLLSATDVRSLLTG